MAENIFNIINMGGLKCDTPGCGYVNEFVPPSDYKNWIDCPCPKCGASLLTKKDYKSFKRLLLFINTVNKVGKIFSKSSKKPTETTIVSVDWHGDYGKPTIELTTKKGDKK